MIKKASTPKLSVQMIVLCATGWAVIALLFFLLFSVAATGQGHPKWYSVITYVLEEVAFLGAGLLCFRNWRSSQIVSGGTVWLAIGLAMFSYFVGNLLLAYWEIALNYSPDISPGDLFYILTYIFLGWGMLRAVIARQLNLTLLQWISLGMIAIAGIGVALLFAPSGEDLAAAPTPPAIEQLVPASPAPATPTAAAQSAPIVAPDPSPDAALVDSTTAPDWAVALEAGLSPLADTVAWLYIIGDVILVVMATALLLAFWGGRFSLSWRFIAAAAFCFYIADIWFNYATTYIPNYETGALPEVFWIFSGCLFAIGAALEYDLSTRRRSTRRRT